MTDRSGNLRVDKESQIFFGEGQLDEVNYFTALHTV